MQPGKKHKGSELKLRPFSRKILPLLQNMIHFSKKNTSKYIIDNN